MAFSISYMASMIFTYLKKHWPRSPPSERSPSKGVLSWSSAEGIAGELSDPTTERMQSVDNGAQGSRSLDILENTPLVMEVLRKDWKSQY